MMPSSRLPPCYVLTLDSPDGVRYRSAAEQLVGLPSPATFVRGVRLTHPAQAPRYSRWRNRLFMKRPMTRGEVGVYMGHRRIWKRMLAARCDVALVLEDDFLITDATAFCHAIADACSMPPVWDIVKLFDYKPKVPLQRWRVNRTDFVTYKYPASGCVAYLIRATAATRLLRRRVIYRPVDEDWSHPWEWDLRVVSVTPNPVTEAAADLGGSLLQEERDAIRSEHRNWFRSLHGGVLSLLKTARARMWRKECEIDHGS